MKEKSCRPYVLEHFYNFIDKCNFFTLESINLKVLKNRSTLQVVLNLPIRYRLLSKTQQLLVYCILIDLWKKVFFSSCSPCIKTKLLSPSIIP